MCEDREPGLSLVTVYAWHSFPVKSLAKARLIFEIVLVVVFVVFNIAGVLVGRVLVFCHVPYRADHNLSVV